MGVFGTELQMESAMLAQFYTHTDTHTYTHIYYSLVYKSDRRDTLSSGLRR